MKTCRLLCVLALLAGCSANQVKTGVYESMQGSARQNCYKLPDAREQMECLHQYETPYPQYRQQREDMNGAAKPAPN